MRTITVPSPCRQRATTSGAMWATTRSRRWSTGRGVGYATCRRSTITCRRCSTSPLPDAFRPTRGEPQRSDTVRGSPLHCPAAHGGQSIGRHAPLLLLFRNTMRRDNVHGLARRELKLGARVAKPAFAGCTPVDAGRLGLSAGFQPAADARWRAVPAELGIHPRRKPRTLDTSFRPLGLAFYTSCGRLSFRDLEDRR